MDSKRLPLLIRPLIAAAPAGAAAFRALACCGSILLGLTASARAGEAFPHFDFLYIDANVGMSSGGHVALRIGDEVFHYQHDPEGFIVLARENWPRFRLIYNDLDNRNIHVARVDVAADALERIRDRFVQRHLIQNRHVDFLAALRKDRDLLQNRRTGNVSPVPGAGLFVPDREAPADLKALGAAIEAQFGAGFLGRKTVDLERLPVDQVYVRPMLAVSEVSDSRYPGYPPTFSEIHDEALAKLAALRVLSGGWGPAAESVLDPRRYGVPDAPLRLTVDERSRLAALERRLRESIFTLTGSARNDSGFPLLLAMARYLAVRTSLARGRLILMHPFFGLTRNVPFPEALDQQRSLVLVSAQLAASFRETRNAFFRLDEPDEASLNLLENSAARYFETYRAVHDRQPFRLPAGLELPRAPGPVDSGRQVLLGQASLQAIGAAEADHRAFHARLQSIYPYNLITRNCATELIRTLNSAFSNQKETVKALGAALDPDDGLVLIPFRLYDQIAQRMRVQRRGVLPSYRNRMLARLSEKENPLWIYLAESNTASSSLYRRRTGDTLFLMFTEDVVWLRPFYGAVNVGFGLANAGAGLLTAPFDHGERFTEGFRGVLFSLPELAFVNIRKGSFPLTRSP